MSLPNPGMDAVPFTPITSEWGDQIIENIEALADGSGLDNGIITPNKLDLDPDGVIVATSQATTSITFADLGTVGPTVTVTIGDNGLALVLWGCRRLNSGANYSAMSYAVSGANTSAAADNKVIASSSGTDIESGTFELLEGLTPGVTTFTAKYRVSGGTGTFINRRLAVIPL